ncbi:MAG: hypothetical protein NT167_29335, partial [Verrucomicrobia bacterium]|nr:hypothetical protein [Verrucomicrobiota bacterium]
ASKQNLLSPFVSLSTTRQKDGILSTLRLTKWQWGNALGSWPQKPSGALKARLILARHEAGRWPATAKRAMNPGRCPGLV